MYCYLPGFKMDIKIGNGRQKQNRESTNKMGLYSKFFFNIYFFNLKDGTIRFTNSCRVVHELQHKKSNYS